MPYTGKVKRYARFSITKKRHIIHRLLQVAWDSSALTKIKLTINRFRIKPSVFEKEGLCILESAMSSGNEELIRYMIHKVGVHLETFTRGKDPLIKACFTSCGLDVFSYLVCEEECLDGKPSEIILNLLRYACKTQHRPNFDTLRHKFEHLLDSSWFEEMLCECARSGRDDQDFVRLLVDEYMCSHPAFTPDTLEHVKYPLVFNACTSGNLDTLKYLCEELYFTKDEIFYEDGCAFKRACANGRAEIVEYLVGRFGKDAVQPFVQDALLKCVDRQPKVHLRKIFGMSSGQFQLCQS